jgi:hypothetical protein
MYLDSFASLDLRLLATTLLAEPRPSYAALASCCSRIRDSGPYSHPARSRTGIPFRTVRTSPPARAFPSRTPCKSSAASLVKHGRFSQMNIRGAGASTQTSLYRPRILPLPSHCTASPQHCTAMATEVHPAMHRPRLQSP